jgi:hypothetical protein
MLSPDTFYVAGALFLALLIAARIVSRKRSAGWVLVAAAAAALESGLLTDFGLLLPYGLLFVLIGVRSQLLAGGIILAVNLAVARLVFRAAMRYAAPPKPA